ncbi:MAG: hypothetical protein BAJALOKI2v1_320019 [Promethearchaeota archaeon]|nr:MAG: hypothetical protein BAJALOKI2v1_320019 [Candidatus Lokiarchaeota archaeon]
MSMNRVAEKLRNDGREFATTEDIKIYSNKLYYNYNNVIQYLTSRGQLLKIFKGVYYVKSIDEIQKNKIKYSLLELVGKGLDLKGIKNWYYGLYTAFKLNGVEPNREKQIFYVISDRLFKRKPISIAGYDFKFIKFKFSLFNFGVKKEMGVKFSDYEKSVLDLVYLWKYSGVHSQKIVVDLGNFIRKVDKERALEYANYYPNTTKKILKEALKK